MNRWRPIVLGASALLLAGWQWGPGYYTMVLPLTSAVVRMGGEWREMHVGNSGPILYVSHQLDQYCFSPGVGAIVEIGEASPDSLFRFALAIKDGMMADARRLDRNNITVTLERRRGIPWPWRARELTFVSFHHRGDGEPWKVTTVSGDLSSSLRPVLLAYNTRGAATKPSGPVPPVDR